MNKSQSIVELTKSLVAFQQEVPAVKMTKSNPMFKNSKYADLGDFIETSRSFLAKNGLAITQFIVSDATGRTIGVTTLLLHTSGEFIEETAYLPSIENNKAISPAQAAGITITYLRRYMWAAVLGMYGGDDTDGNLTGTNAEDEEQDLTEALSLRKTIVEMFNASPELQDKYKAVMSEVGYKSTSADVKLMKELISKLKEIK